MGQGSFGTFHDFSVADPDPACHFDANFDFDADPDPQH